MDDKRIAYLISFLSPDINQEKLEQLIIDIRERGYMTEADEKQFWNMRMPMETIVSFFGEKGDSFRKRLENNKVSFGEVHKILIRMASESKTKFENTNFVKL